MRRERVIHPNVAFDLSHFDKSPELTHQERKFLTHLKSAAAGPEFNEKKRFRGDLGHAKRLVEPLKVVIGHFGFRAGYGEKFMREVLRHVILNNCTYWAWSDEQWIAVSRTHEANPGNFAPQMMSQGVALLAYHLVGKQLGPAFFTTRRFFAPLLAKRLWGSAQVEEACERVLKTLRGIGYSNTKVTDSNVLASLTRFMLILNNPKIDEWRDGAFLANYQTVGDAESVSARHSVWMALYTLGIIEAQPNVTYGRDRTHLDWDPRTNCSATWLDEVDRYCSLSTNEIVSRGVVYE